jgi:hypothetical protein
MRARYLLPAYPVMACLIADILAESGGWSDTMKRRMTVAQQGLILVISAGAGLLLVVGGLLVRSGTVLSGGLVCLASGLILFRLSGREKQSSGVVSLACAMLVVFSAIAVLVKPVFSVSCAPAQAAAISARAEAARNVGAVGFDSRHVGRLHLLLKGRIRVHKLAPDAPRKVLAWFSVLAFSERTRPAIDLTDYDVQPSGFIYPAWDLQRLWRVISSADPKAEMERLRVNCFVAFKQLPPGRR